MKPCLMRNDNLIGINEEAAAEEIKEMFKSAVEKREPYYKENKKPITCKI